MLPPVAVLSEDDLVEIPRAASPLTLTRSQETELPVSTKLAYASATNDYRQAIAESRRLTAGSGRVAQATLAIVLDAELANATADAWLFETWAARERASLVLPPSRIAIEPADLLALQSGSRQRLYRVTEITERGERDIQAMSIDPSVYAAISGAGRSAPDAQGPRAGQPLVEFLDLPLLRGDEPVRAGYVAATQTPWPGGVALYSSPETTGFALKTILTVPATMGHTLTDLGPGPASRLDRATRLRVTLDSGELASATELQLLAGANVAAVRNSDGGWEVLQFEAATLVAPATYELSGLLRGQAGTEAEMRSPVAAGARFILLDASVARIELAPSEVGLPLQWRYGPADRDLGGESYAQSKFAFGGIGQRPLSPVHVTGIRTAGDVAVSWIRRTRTGGDPWEVAEVPLGEDLERYELDIVSAGMVKRTLAVSGPATLYTAAQQIADFGSTQTAVRVRVHQMSTVWGRGVATEVVV